MIGKIIHKLFYTCEDASMYMIRQEENSLNLIRRFRLWAHTRICVFCKLFEIQNQRLNDFVDRSKSSFRSASLKASPEAREKWQKAIRESDKD